MINHPYKTAKGLKRYVRDILQQVQQEETLKKIIDISSKIDYPVIYHLDDDKKLEQCLHYFKYDGFTVASFTFQNQTLF